MKLTRAEKIAAKYIQELAPYCDRIEVAGSIRRLKPTVKDIEIVAIPGGLFEFGLALVIGEAVRVKDGPRYKQIILPEGINLDLFLVLPPAHWGVIFTLRTGPADFSHAIVTSKRYGGKLPSNCRVKDGQVWRNGEVIPMPEEEDFLKLLGLSGLVPEKRAELIGGEKSKGSSLSSKLQAIQDGMSIAPFNPATDRRGAVVMQNGYRTIMAYGPAEETRPVQMASDRVEADMSLRKWREERYNLVVDLPK